MSSMIKPSLSGDNGASLSGATAVSVTSASETPASVPVLLVCGACSTATPHAVRNKRPASSLYGPAIDDIYYLHKTVTS